MFLLFASLFTNMSSVAGLRGQANLTAYNATKGGVRLLTNGVALQCADNLWKVRMISVRTGIIATPVNIRSTIRIKLLIYINFLLRTFATNHTHNKDL